MSISIQLQARKDYYVVVTPTAVTPFPSVLTKAPRALIPFNDNAENGLVFYFQVPGKRLGIFFFPSREKNQSPSSLVSDFSLPLPLRSALSRILSTTIPSVKC